MLHGVTNWHSLLPGFLNLTLTGLILALVFERTRAIYFSVGLHAALVLWSKTYAFLTDPKASGNPWLFGSDKLSDGWAAAAVLLLIFLLLHRTLPSHKEPPAQADPS
jgi:membrane protease YdiL (CAAX protease family)